MISKNTSTTAGLAAVPKIAAAAMMAAMILGSTLCSSSRLVADEVDYDRLVDIVRIDVVAPKSKSDGPTLEIFFNLHAAIPKGAVIQFELLYPVLTYDTMEYTLPSETRRNLKAEWKPKKRLPVDTYAIKSSIPLELQPAAVERAIKKNEKVFPPASTPWSWNYPEIKLKVGDKEMASAEFEVVKKYFRRIVNDELLVMNNEFVVQLEKVEAGTEFVDGGKLDIEKLTEWVEKWRNKYGKVQSEIIGYEKKEPGLFEKYRAEHYFLGELALQVAKRCSVKLKEVLSKYGKTLAELELKPVEGYSDQYRGRVTPAVLGRTYEKISNRVPLSDPEEATSGE